MEYTLIYLNLLIRYVEDRGNDVLDRIPFMSMNICKL